MTSAETGGPSFPDIEPIFVVGVSRSGTTLLRTMLNAHPEIQLLGELQYFGGILPLRERVPRLEDADDVEELCDLVARTYAFQYLKRGEELLAGVREALLEASFPSYPLLHREFLTQYAKLYGASRCGEKTPENVRYLRPLLSLYPRARFIHLVRDPRDVVTSLLGVPWASPDLLTNALRWKIQVTFARDERIRSRSGQFHEVRYEELVTEPERCLRAICGFLDETYSPEMLSFHETAGREVDIEGEPWKARTAQPLDTSSLGRWRAELSDRQVALLQAVCGDEMEYFGYPRAPTSALSSVAAPLLAGIEAIRWLGYKLREGREKARDEDLIYPRTMNAVSMAARAIPVWLRRVVARPRT